MRKLWILSLVPVLAACGTIVNGSSQPIAINSTPTAARITVNGVEMGNTPMTLNLARKQQHAINLQLPGYDPYSINLTRSMSGWVWGNVIFGGLIGLAVDAGTGGLYKLSPDQVNTTLARMGASSLGKDGLLIVVTMQPIEGAQLIGQMTPMTRSVVSE